MTARGVRYLQRIRAGEERILAQHTDSTSEQCWTLVEAPYRAFEHVLSARLPRQRMAVYTVWRRRPVLFVFSLSTGDSVAKWSEWKAQYHCLCRIDEFNDIIFVTKMLIGRFPDQQTLDTRVERALERRTGRTVH